MAPGGYYSPKPQRYYLGTATADSPRYTETETEVDETPNDETLKKEINNLLWMYAPPKMPIGKADEMACQVFEMFKAAQEKYK